MAELTEEEDPRTLAAIEKGIAQLDAGQGIRLEELREALMNRAASFATNNAPN